MWRELREIAQAQYPLDDDAGALAAATRQQHEPRQAGERDPRLTEEYGKVDDAIEIAADVGEAQEPGFGERYRHDLRQRDHFAGFAKANQEATLAAPAAKPRRLDLRGRLAREPGREFLLERAQVEAGGAGHDGGRCAGGGSAERRDLREQRFAVDRL